MKILVVSDTHGFNDVMKKVIRKETPFDLLVHCGDLSMNIEELQALAGAPVRAVAGNNDFFYNLPKNDLFMLGEHKALLVHGHRENVYYGINNLLYSAVENGADIVFFGHTHVPFIDTYDGITFINPGSLTYPRQDKRQETYCVLEIDDDSNVKSYLRFTS